MGYGVDMFIGSYEHKIDAKGRVSFPSRFRRKLDGPAVVITVGNEGNLLAYSYSGWENLNAKLAEISENDLLAQSYIRKLYLYATETLVDDHGRISLTPELKEFAGLTDAAVFVGKPRNVEIWSPETLGEVKEEAMFNEAKIREHMKELGI